jgi:hypothetical protein
MERTMRMDAAGQLGAVEHIVLVRELYALAIAAGRKRVEARLFQTRQVPFGRVQARDVLWFRRVGGGYVARAVVSRITSRAGLTPPGVRTIRRRFGARLGASDSCWSGRSKARYATLVESGQVEARSDGPDVRKKTGDRRACIVVETAAVWHGSRWAGPCSLPGVPGKPHGSPQREPCHTHRRQGIASR